MPRPYEQQNDQEHRANEEEPALFQTLSNAFYAYGKDDAAAKELLSKAFFQISEQYKLDLCSPREHHCYACQDKKTGRATHLLHTDPDQTPSVLKTMTYISLLGLASIPQSTPSGAQAGALETLIQDQHVNGHNSFLKVFHEHNQQTTAIALYEEQSKQFLAKHQGRF